MESSNLPYDALETLRTDGVAFIEIVEEHDPATAIESCPGWTLADLAYHQGEVWHFWGRIVSDGITERGQLKTIRQIERPEHDLIVDWLALSHNELFSALVDAGTEQEVWTWTGANRDTAWVRRRMAQEAAVHRFDAAQATGDPYELGPSMAADGIDEFLMWFAGTERREGELKPGGTVHLHCTDTDDDVTEGSDDRSRVGGEWLVSSLDASGATFTREHAKGDAAVRGRANDLLLWLWRREAGPVEILGDAAVAERFRAFPHL